MKRAFLTPLLTLIAIVSFAMIATAQTSPKSFAGISIHNFGQMTDTLYRGAQPTQGDYKALANFGINTIVDLRSDHESFAEAAAEAAGLKYYLIPMDGVSAPTNGDVAQFLKIVNDPASGKVYFHCKAGIHRTGTMGAVYRLNHDGWDYDKAYTEMKNYEFSAGLFHGGLKSFVKRYSDQMASERAALAAKAPVITPAPVVTKPAVTIPAPVITTAPKTAAPAPVITKVSLITTDPVVTKAPVAAKMPITTKGTIALKSSKSKKAHKTRLTHHTVASHHKGHSHIA